jgi:hypothetical protein
MTELNPASLPHSRTENSAFFFFLFFWGVPSSKTGSVPIDRSDIGRLLLKNIGPRTIKIQTKAFFFLGAEKKTKKGKTTSCLARLPDHLDCFKKE